MLQTLGVFVLLVVVPAQGAGRFEYFHGYCFLGEAIFVSVGSKDQPSQWLQVGKMHRTNRIVSLDLSSQILAITDPNGEMYTLPLTKLEKSPSAPPADSVNQAKATSAMRLPNAGPPPGYKPTVVLEVYPPESIPRSKVSLDWGWIESESNPMRLQPVRLSQSDWNKCQTDAERNNLVELYRQHGWEITVKRTNKSLDIGYEKLRPPGVL